MYDALTTTLPLLVPACTGRRTCGCRASAGSRSSGRRSTGRLPRSSSRAAAASEHPGLVTHDELDWAPLGLAGATTVRQPDDVAASSRSRTSSPTLAATRIKAGEWPWSFFCWPEDRPRPVFPSAFRLLRRAARGDRVGVAVRCPVCGQRLASTSSRARTSTSRSHNDREVGVVAAPVRRRRRVGRRGVPGGAPLERLRRPPARLLSDSFPPARDVEAPGAGPIPQVGHR